MEITKRLVPSWYKVTRPDGDLEFLLAPLTGAQVINIQQIGAERMGDALLLAVEYSVQDWRGITEDGQPAQATRARKDAVFADAVLLSEVGAEIVRRSRLQDNETKN